MRAKVLRYSKDEFRMLVDRLGPKAEYINVPATVPGMMFQGLFVDKTKREVAVMWPTDRSLEAQDDFALKLAQRIDSKTTTGSWPVKDVETGRPELTLVKKEDGTCMH